MKVRAGAAPKLLADVDGRDRKTEEQRFDSRSREIVVSRPKARQQNTKLNLFGLEISGLPTSLVDQGVIKIQAPLKKGLHSFQSIQQDAIIKIKKNSNANICVRFKKDEQGHLRLQKFSLDFDHAICVKNPSAAFLQKQQRSPFLMRLASYVKENLADTLADVKIKKLEVNAQGQILVNGKIKAARFFRVRLDPKVGQIETPNFEEFIFNELLADEGNAPARKKNSNNFLTDFSFEKLLKNISHISDRAHCEIELESTNSVLAAKYKSISLRGANAPVKIVLDSTIYLNSGTNLYIEFGQHLGQINSSFGNFKVNGRLRLNNLADPKNLQACAQVNLLGESKNISAKLEPQSDQQEKFSKRPGPHDVVEKNPLDKMSLAVGAKKLNVAVALSANFRLQEKKLERVQANTRLRVKAKDPFLQSDHRGAQFNGEISSALNIDGFTCDRSQNLFSGSGQMGVAIDPSDEIKRKFPSLQKDIKKYGFEIISPRQMRVSPPQKGIVSVVSAVKNFEGHYDGVDTPSTRENISDIGSAKYFAQVEKICGKKARKISDAEILESGPASLQKRLELIEQSRESIFFQTLIFKDDECSWKIAKALVSAARRGVKVCGIVDSLGNIENISELDESHPIFSYMRENGVDLRLYNANLERGLRKIFSSVKKNHDLKFLKGPSSLKSIATVLDYFHQLIKIIENKEKYAKELRGEILEGLCLMMGSDGPHNPQNIVRDLKRALKNHLTDFSSVLMAIKRLGHASFRWHEKYLIVDYKNAIAGGMNIADEYLKGVSDRPVTVKGKVQSAWRDMDLFLNGDPAVEIYRNFRRNWFYVSGKKLAMGPRIVDSQKDLSQWSSAVVVQHRPHVDGDHHITNFLLYNLRCLKPGEKAWFETPYYLPRGVLQSLQKELIACAKRGVDVRILTNSKKTSDFAPLVEASVFDMRQLLNAGGKIYLRSDDRMVHAKAMVLGDKLAVIGSWNMDNRSASHDSENICALYDRELNLELEQLLAKDFFAHSEEVTLENIGRQKIFDELKSAGMLLGAELV